MLENQQTSVQQWEAGDWRADLFTGKVFKEDSGRIWNGSAQSTSWG